MIGYKIAILILISIFLIYNLYENKKIETFDNNFIKPSNWSELGFNQKLRIYGKQLGKEHGDYADKLKVKEIVSNMNIKNLNIPKNIKFLDRNKDLNLNELPETCIVKTNCGNGDLIIIKNRKIIMMKGRVRNVKTYDEWKKRSLKTLNYKPEIQPHYKYIEPKIYVEEYLGDNLNDYKFFCIQGKMVLCQIDTSRFKNHKRNLYDKNFRLLNFIRGYKNSKTKIKKPQKYEEMVKIVEEISKKTKFDFVRVDLFFVNNKIYIGEITFIPDAAADKYNFKPIKYEYEIGKLWK